MYQGRRCEFCLGGTKGGHLKSTLSVFAALCLLAGCRGGASQSQSAPAAEARPAIPAVPEEVQSAAQSLLGKETQVLLFGDLAKNGKQQFLAANVVPKTPKNNDVAGMIVTRFVVAENRDGNWAEILRCDEHLKNSKGFLAGTPISSVTGWRLQFEQNPEKGLALYVTPMKGGSGDPHVLPIGVRWNPETKRYQSLDHSYEHFLLESAMIGAAARSTLR
jgi:hypothetical protein